MDIQNDLKIIENQGINSLLNELQAQEENIEIRRQVAVTFNFLELYDKYFSLFSNVDQIHISVKPDQHIGLFIKTTILYKEGYIKDLSFIGSDEHKAEGFFVSELNHFENLSPRIINQSVFGIWNIRVDENFKENFLNAFLTPEIKKIYSMNILKRKIPESECNINSSKLKL